MRARVNVVGVAMICIASMTIAACSNGNTTTDTSETLVPPMPSITSTSLGRTASTAPQTTAAPATTTTTTATTTTITEPTTTLAETIDPATRDAIIGAIENSWVVFTNLLLDPNDAHRFAALQDSFLDPQLTAIYNLAIEYQGAHYRLAPHPHVQRVVHVDPASVAVGPDGHSASAEVCVIGGHVLMDYSESPAGTVLDDRSSKTIYHAELLFENSRWLITTEEKTSQIDGVDTCDG